MKLSQFDHAPRSNYILNTLCVSSPLLTDHAVRMTFAAPSFVNRRASNECALSLSHWPLLLSNRFVGRSEH